jgi:peroxiredoxin
MTLLLPGEAFPEITVSRLGGGVLGLPAATAGHYGVVLFYRGSSCPHCVAQLRAFG